MVTASGDTDDSEYGNGDALDLFTVYTAQGKESGIFRQHGVIRETSGYGCLCLFDSRVPLSRAIEELSTKASCHSPVVIHRRHHTRAGKDPGACEVWGTRVGAATSGG